MITLYGKPNCPHCVGTENWLDINEISYQKVNVLEDADALAFLKTKGHRTVPQLYAGDRLLVEGGFSGLQQMGADALREHLYQKAA